jgi:PleD family two-component response regulator
MSFQSLFDSKLKSNPYLGACKCNKVLIVDDEKFNIFIIGKIMKNLEIPFDSAKNGQEALDKVIL